MYLQARLGNPSEEYERPFLHLLRLSRITGEIFATILGRPGARLPYVVSKLEALGWPSHEVLESLEFVLEQMCVHRFAGILDSLCASDILAQVQALRAHWMVGSAACAERAIQSCFGWLTRAARGWPWHLHAQVVPPTMVGPSLSGAMLPGYAAAPAHGPPLGTWQVAAPHPMPAPVRPAAPTAGRSIDDAIDVDGDDEADGREARPAAWRSRDGDAATESDASDGGADADANNADADAAAGAGGSEEDEDQEDAEGRLQALEQIYVEAHLAAQRQNDAARRVQWVGRRAPDAPQWGGGVCRRET